MRSKEIKKELDKANAIATIALMDGGKELAKTARKDMLNCVDRLASSFRTATHTDLISICAELRTSIALVRLLNNAPKNKKLLAEEFEKALQEENEDIS